MTTDGSSSPRAGPDAVRPLQGQVSEAGRDPRQHRVAVVDVRDVVALRDALAGVAKRAPVVPVVSNVTVTPTSDPEEIARRLVEMHGGTMEVVSAPGKGATFSFTLWPEGGLTQDS